ncbi:MAG: hypothetical protein AB7F86_09905 [Bdellovibrionales bacterium]
MFDVRPWLKSAVLAALLTFPLLFFLSKTAQSPDGAEMLVTARVGGVLHPSGMPLQAWAQYLLVHSLEFPQGYTLSVVSWVGMGLTCFLLILTLVELQLPMVGVLGAGVMLVYHPVVSYMAVIPEKYTWLMATQMFFIYLLLRGSHGLWLGLALALALAQHSANVILLPPFFYSIFRSQQPQRIKWGAVLLAGLVTFGFYVSLLGIRGNNFWPDWGHLENLSDVWRHMTRQDYGVLRLSNRDDYSVRSALPVLWQNLVSWSCAFLWVPLGVWYWTRLRSQWVPFAYTIMILFPALAVLAKAEMPAGSDAIALGYQERYPILVWTLVSLYSGWGLACAWTWLNATRATRGGAWTQNLGSVGLLILLLVTMGMYVARAGHFLRFANHRVLEVYQEQANFELQMPTLFWTSSDFIGFAGIPVNIGRAFPAKNMIGMPWYREGVLKIMAPAMYKAITGPNPPDGVPALFRQVLQVGQRLTVTEPSQVLGEPDLMTMAEQTGVLWNFKSDQKQLYTDRLLKNTSHLCDLMDGLAMGLPADGSYFLHELMMSFHYAFRSAHDHLQSLGEVEASTAAQEIAESLLPGHEEPGWLKPCGDFRAALVRFH